MSKHLFQCWLCELWYPAETAEASSCSYCFEVGRQAYLDSYKKRLERGDNWWEKEELEDFEIIYDPEEEE